MNTWKEDITVILDSLQELFNEYGDTVTPTLLVERMERKLHRRLPMHVAAYLHTSQGFVTNNDTYIEQKWLCGKSIGQMVVVSGVAVAVYNPPIPPTTTDTRGKGTAAMKYRSPPSITFAK